LLKPRKTIAVVDDDPIMLKAIVRLLHANGFRTQAFASAQAFLTGDNATTADCLVLDIDLGEMSGIELRRQLTVSDSCLPVIFITGLNDKALRDEAIAAGCVAYLRKPFAADALLAAIHKSTG
jgi:FixJ family two-component response regulator